MTACLVDWSWSGLMFVSRALLADFANEHLEDPMSSISLFAAPTPGMNPVAAGLLDDLDLDAETEARALLIANGLLAGPAVVPTNSDFGTGEADLEVEIEDRELLLGDEEWQALPDESDPYAEVLDDEHRRRQLARLRLLLNELRETAPSTYRMMAMYWGLDGECVSTIAAIAHKLHQDKAATESVVRGVMTALQDALGVKRPGPLQLRIAYTSRDPEPMVMPTRRAQDQPGKRLAA